MSEESPEINVDDLQLDDVVGMEVDDLTDTHREFLDTNQSYLTEDQATKFGFGADTSGDKDEGGEKDDDKESTDATDEDEKDDFDPDKVEMKTKKKIGADDFGDEEDDDDMDEEDREKIRKQVSRGNKGIIKRQQDFEDRQALNNIVSNKPELKKYNGLAFKYMKSHPTLTAEDAMGLASGKDQQKIGARKEREAAEKAKRTQSGGSSHRSTSGGAKNWGTASNEDVEAQIARAKGQRI